MNATQSRFAAALLAIILAILSAFSVSGEGGDGTGGGDNHDKPLILMYQSVQDGASNVAPDEPIVLKFSKNVVNIVVREQNQNCFSVKDSSENSIPIRVEMGDDQIEPTDAVKRTVTVVPQSPFRSGETYTLTISGDLAAKNGRDILGNDVTIHFTVADKTTTQRAVSVQAHAEPAATTTTTTTVPAETTTKAARTTKPVIVAATATKADKSETTAVTAHTVVTATKQITTVTVSRTTTAPQTSATIPAVSSVSQPAEPIPETEPQTQTYAQEETTSVYQPQTAAPEPETTRQAQITVPQTEENVRRSPAFLIGFIIAFAAVAGVIIGIIIKKKKKG